jgi:hypothetical protein
MSNIRLKAKARPLFEHPTDYEDDDYAWLYEQAELLRLGRYAELDRANLISELQDVGSEKKAALASQYRRLLQHLLKWRFQPERRGSSWDLTIADARVQIEDREADSPTLKSLASDLVRSEYRRARRFASKETGLPLSDFPAECPFTLDQLRDEDWLPE